MPDTPTSRHRARLKLEVYAHYGNKCEKCPEADPDVLTIDYTDQNGAAHRKEISKYPKQFGGDQMRRWLKQNDYPPGFRLLCANCNIKAFQEHRRKEFNDT